MRILLSNDDGVLAEGLHALRRRLAEIADVYVVAPDRERSSCSHSITVHRPLRAQKMLFDGMKDNFWAVNGTPADCIKLALEALLGDPPDLVVSGINLGANLGNDVLYSGTVSAAMEGAINGIPSVAVSLDSSEPTMLPYAAEFARFLCAQLRGRHLQASLLLNVNIPNLPPEEIRGVEITSLGLRRYEKVVHQRKDPRGRPYYWIAGDVWDDKDGDGTDVAAVAAGKIAITPLHFNLTNYEMLGKLRSWRLGQDFNLTAEE